MQIRNNFKLKAFILGPFWALYKKLWPAAVIGFTCYFILAQAAFVMKNIWVLILGALLMHLVYGIFWNRWYTRMLMNKGVISRRSKGSKE